MLGKQGYQQAISAWKASGLSLKKRSQIGMAIQRLLEILDRKLQAEACTCLHGYFYLADDACAFYSDDQKIAITQKN